MALQLAKIDKKTFNKLILPHIHRPKRGPKSKLEYYQCFKLILHRLKTGTQWRSMQLVINSVKVDYSWQSLYYHFRKWCQSKVFKTVFRELLKQREPKLLSALVLDGSQTSSHNGGQAVAYQGRKKAKTTNQLILTDRGGKIMGLGLPQAGHHHDSYQLVRQVKDMLGLLRKSGFKVHKALVHADKGFDNKAFRKYLWNTGLVPNIAENRRNRKRAKPGPKRFFDGQAYGKRFVVERTFGWFDSFKALLIRYEKRVDHWQELNYLAACLININAK